MQRGLGTMQVPLACHVQRSMRVGSQMGTPQATATPTPAGGGPGRAYGCSPLPTTCCSSISCRLCAQRWLLHAQGALLRMNAGVNAGAHGVGCPIKIFVESCTRTHSVSTVKDEQSIKWLVAFIAFQVFVRKFLEKTIFSFYYLFILRCLCHFRMATGDT